MAIPKRDVNGQYLEPPTITDEELKRFEFLKKNKCWTVEFIELRQRIADIEQMKRNSEDVQGIGNRYYD